MDDIRMAADVVAKINSEVDYIEGLSELIYITMTTDGWNVGIEFLGSLLWRSSDDERDFIEDINDYEPLEDYIRREMQELIGNVERYKR